MASAVLQEELSCSVCLNIYTEPVSLRCGHAFCLACIEKVLDTQKDSGGYSCPECREEYAERPVLERNRKLCNIAKQFRVTQSQLEGSGISCIYCTHAPILAVKTCLQCETSLCDRHLSIHNSAVDHVLVDPTESLESRKCPIHKKLLEYHCCEDATCICVSCFAIGSHRKHQVVTLDEAMTQKKEELQKVLEKLTSESGKLENKVQSLLDLQVSELGKVAETKQRCTELFKDARTQLDQVETQILSLISEQEDEITADISHSIKKLESQKELLSKKKHCIEELCKMADPLLFLQDEELDSINFGGLESLKIAAKKVMDKSWGAEFNESRITASMHAALSNFVTRLKKGYYIPENTGISLDIDTAAGNVLVSGDRKTASWVEAPLSRPENSKRCVTYCQVFGRESFSKGQHYWEVDTSKSAFWMAGLAYASIGVESKIGHNEKSWCINRTEKGYLAVHNSMSSKIYPKSPLQRLGIYLDYDSGRLYFYQLGDPIRPLKVFSATFTEPLYPAFVLWKDGWIRLKA